MLHDGICWTNQESTPQMEGQTIRIKITIIIIIIRTLSYEKCCASMSTPGGVILSHVSTHHIIPWFKKKKKCSPNKTGTLGIWRQSLSFKVLLNSNTKNLTMLIQVVLKNVEIPLCHKTVKRHGLLLNINHCGQNTE